MARTAPLAGLPPRARAALLAALGAGLLLARAALPPPPPDLALADPADPSGTAAAPPPDSALALVAGAFRPLAADVLWLRIEALTAADRREEVLPLARLLLAIDPRSEAAWYVAASSIGTDAPAFEDDPDVVWRWKRQGILLLQEGARRNPRSWFLRHRLGLFLEMQVARKEALAERFRLDRAVNPEGRSALEAALAAYRAAQAHPARPAYVDEGVARLGRLLEGRGR